MVDWQIERVDRSHDRVSFSCGKPSLDEFIGQLVNQYEKRNLGRTYVAVRPGEKTVFGYYTLASSSIAFQNLPQTTSRKLPKHPIPVILIARLAVDRKVQGHRLGEALLMDALERCLELADKIGVHAVEVAAMDLSARAFYERYGFVPLPDSPLHLFLPLSTFRNSK